MTENADKRIEEAPLFDPLMQTERIAFEPAQMIACGKCGRLNPPNRLKCIYCVHDLEIPIENAGSIDLHFRKLEIWELGFNIIFSGKAADTAIDTSKIGKLLSLQPSEVETILDANVPLPLARVESEMGASIIITRLSQLGILSTVISDANLAVDKPPVRLSRIDFQNDRIVLKAFNTGLSTEFDAGDLAFIVPGIVFVGKVDSIERKGRRGKTKLIDETEINTDETVLDLYSHHDPLGFRVQLTGFDFSCLGEDKGLLAAENIGRLIARLRSYAPNARFVDNYPAVRTLLDPIWEVETRKDTKGLQNAGFGKRGFGNVSSRSNLNQFTKYSRLQRVIYETVD